MNKLLFPALAIIAAIGMYFMFIRPTQADIELLQEKKDTFEAQLADAREVENILAELNTSYVSIEQEKLGQLEFIIPKTVDIPRLVQNIHGVAVKNGAEVLSIDLVEGTTRDEDASYNKHEIKVGLSAQYLSFISFLKDMETNLLFSNATAINVGNVNDNSRDTTVRSPYTVTFTFYSAR